MKDIGKEFAVGKWSENLPTYTIENEAKRSISIEFQSCQSGKLWCKNKTYPRPVQRIAARWNHVSHEFDSKDPGILAGKGMLKTILTFPARIFTR